MIKLYVDAIHYIRGGYTSDMSKIKSNLAAIGKTLEEITANMGDRQLVTAMYSAGRYIVICQILRSGSSGRMHFIDYEVNIQELFDNLADSYPPAILQNIHAFQTKIKSQPQAVTDRFILSDDQSMFEIFSQN